MSAVQEEKRVLQFELQGLDNNLKGETKSKFNRRTCGSESTRAKLTDSFLSLIHSTHLQYISTQLIADHQFSSLCLLLCLILRKSKLGANLKLEF